MKVIEFRVAGFPAPKGSMRAVGNRVIPSGGPANKAAQADWGTNVREAATAAKVAAGFEGIMFVKVPLAISVLWYMQRPTGHFYDKGPRIGQLKDKAPRYPLSAPDTSKLLRSLEDWLNKLVWDDDARVVQTQMRKEYAPAPGREGAWVKITQMEES